MNLVQFKTGPAISFLNSLDPKDANTLYFLSDTKQIYKGEELYSKSYKVFMNTEDLPEQGTVGIAYFIKNTRVIKEWDAESGTYVDIFNVANLYDQSVIRLSANGTTVTYVTGDGEEHTFETQDTNTTYSLATDSELGIIKLYSTTGNNEDGTMTQKAITEALNTKVGASVNTATETAIFE